MTQIPIVKLRSGKGARLAHGAPWAFTDEIAMDRRTKALEAGALVHLMDGERDLGLAAFNGHSQITARLLDCGAQTEVDAAWFAARLHRSRSLRDRLYDAPYYRLVHAEADGLPGVVIDRFGGAVVIQPNAAWADRRIGMLIDAVTQVLAPEAIVVNATSRVRKLEGLDEHLDVVKGTLDGPVTVPMNGAQYLADLTGGQKTGLFYDQRPNHAFVQAFARDARVLDVFCHVGGFGLACLAAGAGQVLGVDSSAPALSLASDGARLMQVEPAFETQKADAFAALGALAGEQFDMVICDPPAFAPNRGAVAAGLRAYERIARLATPLVKPDGMLVLCSCSHAAGIEAFHKACVTGIGKARRSGALIHSGRAGPDHPVHIGLPESSYLKSLVFRLGA